MQKEAVSVNFASGVRDEYKSEFRYHEQSNGGKNHHNYYYIIKYVNFTILLDLKLTVSSPHALSTDVASLSATMFAQLQYRHKCIKNKTPDMREIRK